LVTFSNLGSTVGAARLATSVTDRPFVLTEYRSAFYQMWRLIWRR